MEVRQLFAIVRKWLWLLLAAPLLAGGAAYLVSQRQTPIYQATSTVLVSQAQPITGPTYSDVLANQQLTKTYSRLITSAPVVERIATNLNLPFDAVRGALSAQEQTDTQLIDITAEQPDADLAARLANEAATAFADQIGQTQAARQRAAEQDLQNQISSAQAELDREEATLRTLRVPSATLSEPDRQQRLADAQYQYDSLRRNLGTLLTMQQQLRLELARTASNVSVASPARVPNRPARPRTTLNIVLGVMLGLMVASGAVFVIEYLDDTVRSAEGVRRATHAPLLGGVGAFGRSRQRRWWGRGGARDEADRLVVGRREHRQAEESLRMVSANLPFTSSARHARSLLVTSVAPRDGKSTMAANLAALFGQSGYRVVLIDADLRFPVQHQLFGVPNDAGLSTLLAADEPWLDEALRSTQFANLRVLPSGPVPLSPAEWLGSPRMAALLKQVKERADLVVIDSPAVLAVADAGILAAHADGVVLVVDANHARSQELSQAAEIVRRAGAPLWGVILNKLPDSPEQVYYRSA